ncbi:MAG TPA: MgtC/SapB family protein [Prolixibacteraceae bacterium]|nr:MgtC/SapB family protein [Prolixibacteraceae bacterium]
MDLNVLINSTVIDTETAALRLIVSFFAGLLVGVEREAHSQPAGLRTHILISIGSTLAMLLSIYIPQQFPDFQNGDPGRIAAQVIAGIGFLGAGAILRIGGNVKGLTTAASIWAMAIIGLAIGAGLFGISAIALGIILFSLTVMDIFEKLFFQDKIYKKIEITVKKNTAQPEDFKGVLHALKIKISAVDIRKSMADTTEKFTYYVYIPVKLDPQKLAGMIEKTEGVVAFSEELVT